MTHLLRRKHYRDCGRFYLLISESEICATLFLANGPRSSLYAAADVSRHPFRQRAFICTVLSEYSIHRRIFRGHMPHDLMNLFPCTCYSGPRCTGLRIPVASVPSARAYHRSRFIGFLATVSLPARSAIVWLCSASFLLPSLICAHALCARLLCPPFDSLLLFAVFRPQLLQRFVNSFDAISNATSPLLFCVVW